MSTTSGAAAAAEFRRRVAEATRGTPYVVDGTESGFDVTLDVVDAQWYGVLDKAGVSKVFIHHVKIAGDRYSITDDSRTLEWVAGVPRLMASGGRFMGRVIEVGHRTVWAFDAHGHFGIQADYSFDSDEGRDLITAVGEQLGLRQRRGTAERIGLSVALATVVGLVVAGLVALALLLFTDYFS